MADPICRWRYALPENLLFFINILPREVMLKDEFRRFIEEKCKGFLTTPYQLAKQMGLYYEDDKCYYPRFTSIPTYQEAIDYLIKWSMLYYSPNPYTKSIPAAVPPKLIYAQLCKVALMNNLRGASIEDYSEMVFGFSGIGNYDAIVKYINANTDLCIDKNKIVSFKEGMQPHEADLSKQDSLDRNDAKMFFDHFGTSESRLTITHSMPAVVRDSSRYLSALRTKPFLLLAGISGTGKSRIVKEMAFASCPNRNGLRDDSVTPGNYCLVEVKPNWHDSTDLIGYESVLNGGNYILKPFSKFIIKAMQNPDVPFFVCLDEMNLAPVEQYFAEFLSVLESRKDKSNGDIETEALIPSDIFVKYQNKLYPELFGKKKEKKVTSSYEQALCTDPAEIYINKYYAELEEKGLRIPHNLIVVGTVNMDDTTYQFSRKVIDRAMVIEMNEVNLDKMFDDTRCDPLNYSDEYLHKDWFLAPYAQSASAMKTDLLKADKNLLIERIKSVIGQRDENGNVPDDTLEQILGNTPFRIAYRVVNELILHFAALRWEEKTVDFSTLFDIAMDDILMMKVLPRIEGNEDLVRKPLTKLNSWTQVIYPKANKKVNDMLGRLDNSHFTSFWP